MQVDDRDPVPAARNDPRAGQDRNPSSTEQEKQQSNRTQQVQRALSVIGQEIDGQQIQKSFHNAADAIFRRTMFTWPMMHDNFADGPAARGCQHRHKPMHLAIQVNLVENLAAVALKTTVVIMQLDTCQTPYEPVKDARWSDLVPRVMAHLLPAADHINPLAHLG